MNTQRWIAALAMCCLLNIGTAAAGQFGLATRFGTTGFGLEADYALTDQLGVRAQINRFKIHIDYDDDENDIVTRYGGDLRLFTYGLLLDWHPFEGVFRLTAGAYGIANKLTAAAGGDPGAEYEIGDRTFIDSGDVRLEAKLKAKSKFAPYLGLGWGHSPTNREGFMGSFEIGVMFGSPKFSLSASGTAIDQETGEPVNLATDPLAQIELAKERAEFEEDLSDFKIYPVIGFSSGWRF